MPRNLLALMLLTASSQAFAQQTTANAVTQSEDAFGRAVGNERIGIYSSDEVRGFNPSEAGNNRLEGLYIDMQGITPPRLLDGSSIRVGYAARGTPFPAPTGVVDTRMEKFTGTTRFNAELEGEDYANIGGSAEAKIAVAGDSFGLALGYGFREADQVQLRNGSFRNYLVGFTWLPAKNTEVSLFASGFRSRGAENAAVFYPAGSNLPPRQPRKLQQTQPWALNRFKGAVNGAVIKTPLADDLKLEVGLFLTSRREIERFVTLLLDVQQDGQVADHVVIADEGNKVRSYSGEVRVTKTWTGYTFRHNLIASMRGRDQNRIYGGQRRISFGTSQVGMQDVRTQPVIAFGPKDQSHVKQYTTGLQYVVQTKTGSMLSLVLQKAFYRKAIDFANLALADTVSRDSPWLFSASGALAIGDRLTVYGGYVRGLEESALAPDIAVNRNEAPPALRTNQKDFGLRYALTPQLALIAGVFEVKKPYYAVNAATRFAELGVVSNRGVELSLAGTLTKGLTVVAGGLLVNPRISGAEVAAGRIGARPLGSFKQRGIFNLDWKPAGQDAWSFDVALDGSSSEMADRLNTFSVPGKQTINLGARYRFPLAGAKMLLRAQVLNLFDSYGWRVNSSGGFSTTAPRIFALQAIADF